MFMRVTEVADALDVSEPYACKLICKLNEELRQKGCIVIAGRIDRRFFYEKFYGSIGIYAIANRCNSVNTDLKCCFRGADENPDLKRNRR
jgi:hypothetical protein